MVVKAGVLIIKEKNHLNKLVSKNHQLPYVEKRCSEISQR